MGTEIHRLDTADCTTDRLCVCMCVCVCVCGENSIRHVDTISSPTCCATCCTTDRTVCGQLYSSPNIISVMNATNAAWIRRDHLEDLRVDGRMTSQRNLYNSACTIWVFLAHNRVGAVVNMAMKSRNFLTSHVANSQGLCATQLPNIHFWSRWPIFLSEMFCFWEGKC
jgi:hypothetical protein